MKKEFNLEIFNRMLDKVVKWNAIGGNSVDNKGLIPTYMALSREEFFGKDEFLQGWFSDDKVMQADGLGDLVFTFGFLCKLVGSKDYLLSDEGVLISNIKSLISYMTNNLIEADLQDSQFWCEDLYALCLKFSEIMDVEGVFNTIYESNMSKYMPKSQVEAVAEPFNISLDGWEEGNAETLNSSVERVLQEEYAMIRDQGRYAGISSYENEGYIVFTAEEDLQSGVVFSTPKIIKPSCFQEVTGLEQFIY